MGNQNQNQGWSNNAYTYQNNGPMQGPNRQQNNQGYVAPYYNPQS